MTQGTSAFEPDVPAPAADPSEGAAVDQPDIKKLGEALRDRIEIRSLSMTGLFVLAAFYTLYFARAFFLPIILAVLLDFLLSPLIRGLKRARIPEPLGAALVIIALLGLAAVVVGQVWLARRFRRTINRGMLASAIVLLLVLVGGGLTLLNLTNSVRVIESGSFTLVRAAADARIDANNAKSNESLTLIARGEAVSDDASTAVVLTAMFSIGVVLVSRRSSYTSDLTSFLFNREIAVQIDYSRCTDPALATAKSPARRSSLRYAPPLFAGGAGTRLWPLSRGAKPMPKCSAEAWSKPRSARNCRPASASGVASWST